MKSNMKDMVQEIMKFLEQNATPEKIMDCDCTEWRTYFRNKYDNEKTWPVQSIPDEIINIISLLRLQNCNDSKGT